MEMIVDSSVCISQFIQAFVGAILVIICILEHVKMFNKQCVLVVPSSHILTQSTAPHTLELRTTELPSCLSFCYVPLFCFPLRLASPEFRLKIISKMLV